MRWFCLLKRQKLRPEGGLPTEEPKRRPRCFCGSRDPAAKAMVLSAQKAKASPRGRGSYRRAKAQPASLCGSRDPRRMLRFYLLKRQKLRPEGGAPTEEPKRRPRCFCGSRAPRRMLRFCLLKSKSFAPRSGLLQKSQSAARVVFFVGGATRGECGGSACSKAKLRPEVGPPTEEPKRRSRRLFCGRRAPRRMRWFCQLKSKSFAPRSGLLQKSQSAARVALWEPRPAANAEVLPAQKAKASPRGRGSYRRAKAPPALLLWEPRPAANAEVLPAQKQKLRPEVGAPTEEPKCRPRRFFCGRRDPRRMRRFCLLKSQASPRGRGSYIPTASAGVVSSTATAQPAEVPPIACPESASAALALR